MKRLFIILIGTTLLFTSCIHKNKSNVTKEQSLNVLYKKAMNYYNNKQYNNAINEFKVIMFQFPGSNKMEEAQFYIGESYFRMGKYSDAINEYSFLVNSFVGSKYVKNAKFKIAMCYYFLSPPPYLDQTDTHKAEDMFNEYLEMYPTAPEADSVKSMIKKCHLKYLKKIMNAARLYYKMGQYRSSYIYLEQAKNMKDHILIQNEINSLIDKLNTKLKKNKFKSTILKKPKFNK